MRPPGATPGLEREGDLAVENEQKNQQKNQYVAKYAARIEQWEAELDKLKARAAEATADARLKLQREIGDLQAKTADQRRKLDEIRHAGGEAWTDLRTGFERAWDDVQSAWARLKE
jgi:predicted RNase H-like nuclease (RuvC/YqgF family)